MRIQDAILYGSKGGSSPSGSIEITENGTYDVTEKAEAVVNVPSNEDKIIDRSISGKYTNNNVTSIGIDAFNGCISLAEVDFPNVTSIRDYAFSRCSSLTKANFPNTTSIGNSAFPSCSSLTEVNFPNATSIGNYAFSDCISLTEVDFPNVTRIDMFAFKNCNKLTEADFPSATSIGGYCFNDCRNFDSLILRNTDSVCTLSGTDSFKNTPISSGTGYIYVPAALIDSYKAATNWSTYAAQFRALEDYTVDGTTTGDLDPTKI